MPCSSPRVKRCLVSLFLMVWGVTLLEPRAVSSNQTEPETAVEERFPLPQTLPPSNIASALRHVVSRMQRAGLTAANVATRQPETYTTSLVRVDALGRLHTAIVVSRFDTQAAAALAAQQVQLDKVEMSAHVVQAWVPFERLEAVAVLPFVRLLRPPRYARRR